MASPNHSLTSLTFPESERSMDPMADMREGITCRVRIVARSLSKGHLCIELIVEYNLTRGMIMHFSMLKNRVPMYLTYLEQVSVTLIWCLYFKTHFLFLNILVIDVYHFVLIKNSVWNLTLRLSWTTVHPCLTSIPSPKLFLDRISLKEE